MDRGSAQQVTVGSGKMFQNRGMDQVESTIKQISDNVGYQLKISPAAKALADADSLEECMV